MASIARALPMDGSVVATLVPRHGYYGYGSTLLPADMGLRYRVRSWLVELACRPRLALAGLWRGLQGKGIIGVGRLYATLYRAGQAPMHLGLLSTKVVTDAGVAYIVDDWDGGANTIDLFNYHGCGTGVGAEAAGDTALGTESTTALNPNSTRATGTKSQPSANVMRSVGTLTFDAGAAITEHGIFTQSATGGGTLLDRSVFSAINVVSGDSIQFTYDLTLTSGS